jgi:hypothetical protein
MSVHEGFCNKLGCAEMYFTYETVTTRIHLFLKLIAFN